jgi:hypothetical protein
VKLLRCLWIVVSSSFFVTARLAADALPPDASYRALPTLPFAVKSLDEAVRPAVLARQRALLNQRDDLSDHPLPGVMMSAGRKPVQGGVRAVFPDGQINEIQEQEQRNLRRFDVDFDLPDRFRLLVQLANSTRSG